MNIKKIVQIYDTHMNNVKSRIATGGIPFIKGKDIFEKKDYFKNNMDEIRKFVLLKPRGSKDLSGIVITEPSSFDADLACIFMDTDGYEKCYIEDLVGAFTVIAETGMISIEHENISLKLETQFGIFEGKIIYQDESVKSISIMYHNDCIIKSKETNMLVEKEDTLEYKSFITGMSILMLDKEDCII